MISAHNTIGELVTNGLVAPIDLGDDINNYTPASIQAWTYNGELYGLPQSTENVGFFINTDIVSECPATWTEVIEISRELAADNDEEFETNKYGFVAQDNDPYHFFPIQTAFDGYIFGVTDQGYNPNDIGLDSEGSIAAITWWDTLIKEGLKPEGIDDPVMMDMFESSQAAMIITGPWNTQRVIDSGVGELMEAAGPDAHVLVYSDHGSAPLHRLVFVNTFLVQRGIVTMKGTKKATDAGEAPVMREGLLDRRRLGRALERFHLGGVARVVPRSIKRRFPTWTRSRCLFAAL